MHQTHVCMLIWHLSVSKPTHILNFQLFKWNVKGANCVQTLLTCVAWILVADIAQDHTGEVSFKDSLKEEAMNMDA